MLEHVEKKSIETVSFDVFDTLIFRNVCQPSDIFSFALKNSNAAKTIGMSAAEFQELRVYVEKKVKRDSIVGEVTLEEIYADMPFDESSKRELLESELATEKAMSFVFPDMVLLVEELKRRGVRVLLISDMYLSPEQIRTTFFEEYPTLNSIPLYVSSEHKKNKARGEMFTFLAKELRIPYSNWLHLGDHAISDYEVPRKLGIESILLAPRLNFNRVIKTETSLFCQKQHFNAARFISALHGPENSTNIAFDIGAIVWGPILFSFTDWVIDCAVRANCSEVLFLMREAEVFKPIFELRLKQRAIDGINVKRLFASRKSTFWAAVDTSNNDWLEDLMYTLVQRRGYTVDDFYHDFSLTSDKLRVKYCKLKIRDTDGVFDNGINLLKLLTSAARKNLSKIEEFINQQKRQFSLYYENFIGIPLTECFLVDLGGGGTIQRQVENILGCRSKANLLFYSTERIYRFSNSSHYHSFLNAQTDSGNMRQILARSPECVEPFLVGDCGTTTGYKNDSCGSPVLADKLQGNTQVCRDFIAGVLQYFKTHANLNFDQILIPEIIPILSRYIQFPIKEEARLFTQILHQDNFGSNDSYPIVTQCQIAEIQDKTIGEFYLKFRQTPRLGLGVIHWPQAVITLLDESFLLKQQGLMSLDTENDVLELLVRLKERGWKQVSVYGAGIFFERLLPHLTDNNISIVQVIDRKAEISGEYSVAGYAVVSLKDAMQKGIDKLLISSYAFKNEIARNVYDSTLQSSTQSIDILSL